MPAPVIVPEPVDDNFAEAFDKLTEIVPAAPEAPVTPPTPSDDHAPTAEGAEGSPANGEGSPETPAEGAPAGEGTPAEPAKEPAKESADDLMAKLRAMVTPPEPVTPPAPTPEAPAAPALFTAEEQETLTNYERDWPEVVAGQALRERKMAHDIVSHIFAELAPVLRPILDTTTDYNNREQLSLLQSHVPDYLEIRDAVEAWALDEKQPAYLRAAYQHVIQEGTADEVVDLIQRYKSAVGAPAPTPAAKRTPETELPAATKKAVASLAPVSSKRSVVTGKQDPLDFDGAFSAFADDA